MLVCQSKANLEVKILFSSFKTQSLRKSMHGLVLDMRIPRSILVHVYLPLKFKFNVIVNLRTGI